MRPIVIPGTGRSLTRVTTRVRNLERRYIPTTNAVLDYCWIIGLDTLVAGTSQQMADLQTIHASTAPFSLVTDSVDYWPGAPYNIHALKCPTGAYLVNASMNISVYIDPVDGPWFYSVYTKQSVAGWGHSEEHDDTDRWRTPTTDPDPNVIPQSLIGATMVGVEELSATPGYGLMSVLVRNEGTNAHNLSGSLYVVRLALGDISDADHSTAPGPPATPSTTPGSQPQSLPGVQGPATVG